MHTWWFRIFAWSWRYGYYNGFISLHYIYSSDWDVHTWSFRSFVVLLLYIDTILISYRWTLFYFSSDWDVHKCWFRIFAVLFLDWDAILILCWCTIYLQQIWSRSKTQMIYVTYKGQVFDSKNRKNRLMDWIVKWVIFP